MGTLEGKVAIVTGAARGLGRAFAERLASEGAGIVACDLLDAVHELDGLTYEANVGLVDDVRMVVDGAMSRHGRIDVLVNNAGICRRTEPTDSWDQAIEDYEATMATNTRGAFLFGRAVAPIMVEQGAGHIVNISSDHIFPMPGIEVRGHGHMDVYNASKWALNGLTLDWAMALRDKGVRVNGLCMGATDSEMLRSWLGGSPPDDIVATWMRPEQTAALLVQLLDEGPDGRTGYNIGLWVGRPISIDDSVVVGAQLPG